MGSCPRALSYAAFGSDLSLYRENADAVGRPGGGIVSQTRQKHGLRAEQFHGYLTLPNDT